jgi:branched-chain amino acid transport system ATP-binding protein
LNHSEVGGAPNLPSLGQNVQEALEIAHYAYVLQTGRMVMEGKPADLLKTDLIKKAYLGL